MSTGDRRDPPEEDFFALVAHDLHSPVAALLLQLGSLRRLTANGHGRDKLLERVDKALLATERLGVLLGGVLEVSRIDRGKETGEAGAVDLAAVIRDTAAALECQAKNAGCQLIVSAPDPVEGEWHHRRVEQICAHLLGHALRVGRGGDIEVSLLAEDGLALVRVSMSAGLESGGPAQDIDSLELRLAQRIAISQGGEVVARAGRIDGRLPLRPRSR